MNSVWSVIAVSGLALVLSMLLTAIGEWAPALSERVIWLAARFLPREHRLRYQEEWIAELHQLDGLHISALIWATIILVRAPLLAFAVRASEDSRGTKATNQRTRDPVTSDMGRKRRLAVVFEVLLVAFVLGLLVIMIYSSPVDSGSVTAAAVTIGLTTAVLGLGAALVRRAEAQRELRWKLEREQAQESADAVKSQLETALQAFAHARKSEDQDRAASEVAEIFARCVAASRYEGSLAARERSGNDAEDTMIEGTRLQPG